jgi:ArsR family transcriptional regulator
MQRLLDLLGAAADPSRLRILLLLRDVELSMSELATVLGQSQPRISRHVRILVETGLVRRSKEGAYAFVAAARTPEADALFALLSRLDADGAADGADLKRLAEVRHARQAALDHWFAENAAEWDSLRAIEAPVARVEAALGAMLARPLGRLLDAGTGTGRMLELLAGSAARAVGLDRSAEMLRIARIKLDAAGLSGVDLHLGDILAAPFPDATFDTLVLHQVLHYLDRPEVALEQAARLLAPGGQLLVVDYGPHEVEALAQQFRHRHPGFARADMETMMTKLGLLPDGFEALAGERLSVFLWRAVKP